VDTVTVTTTVNVISVNTAPVIANLDQDTLNYDENAGVQLIDQGNAPAVTDGDSADFGGGSLLVSLGATALAEDQLSIVPSGLLGFSGSVVSYDGTTFGNVSGGANGADLVVAFNASADETAVTALLATIAYENTSELPSTAQRLVHFDVVDGDGTDNGGSDTGSATATINVTSINDKPVISDLNGDSLAYDEGSGPLVIDQGTSASLADIDALDFDGGTVTASVASGGTASEDVLSIQATNDISVTVNAVAYQGTTIGTFAGGTNGVNLVVSLNSDSGATSVSALLNAIAYENTSPAPDTTQRTVTIEFNDGDGTDNGGVATDTAATTITVTSINAAALVNDLNGDTLSYAESSGAKVIDQGAPASVVDSDSPDFDLGSLKVSFLSGSTVAEDVLAFDTSGAIGFDGTNLSHSGTPIGTAGGGSNGADLEVIFNSSATPLAVSALLAAITYENTSELPSTAQRLVEFTLVDGDGVANGGADTTVTSTTINVASVNDAPALDNVSGDTLSYTENDPPQLIDQGSLAVELAAISDVDSPNFDGGSLTVSISSGGVANEDALWFDTSGDISFDGTNVSHSGTAIGTPAGGRSAQSLTRTRRTRRALCSAW
jgi:hypothetical protein